MKRITIGMATAALAIALSGSARADVAYLRSTIGAPWGQSTNESAMNTVFGAAGWKDLRYENVNPTSLFSASTSFVYMEGSDSNATALSKFLATNLGMIESWVAAGGHLFLNAAPNAGQNINFGFRNSNFPDVTLNYQGPDGNTFSSTGAALNPAHPIFNGPFGKPGTSFTGNFFAQAVLTGGGIKPIMTGDVGTVLAELVYGKGRVVFGALTTDNFESPRPQSHILRENIIAYASSVNLTAIPEPSSLALLGVGLATAVVAARRGRPPSRADPADAGT
jgi:hypothetical protein